MTKNSKLSDIAKLAHVSESTVSRALSGSQLVNEKTRARIKKIAAELNFTVNTAARNLRLQKSNTIAIMLRIDSTEDQSASDPFILSLMGVVADELRSIGYDLLLMSDECNEPLWVKNLFDSKRADGLIIFGQGDNSYPDIHYSDRPIVVWGERDEMAPYPTVGTDNFLGGKLATQHLLEQGCRNIAFAGRLSYETGARFEGYKAALKAAGLHYSQHLDVHFTYTDGHAVAESLAQQNSFHYDGIVAASDSIALGMIKALRARNIGVPDDVAFVGYDDISVAGFTHPSLSTIRQDTQAGGVKLVHMLKDMMAGEKVSSVVLPTELIVRESSHRSR
ncbi:MAG: LacI family DNA-binding transcriptional regulator [Aestuariibacter sp.]